MTHLSFFDGKSYDIHFHKNNVTWPFSANGLCEVTWHTKKNCFAPGADNLEQATPQFCSGGSRRRGGGGQSSRLWDKGGPGSKKIWSKNRGATQVPPLDSPLFCAKVILKIYWLVKMSRQEYIDVAFSGLLSPYGLLFPPKPFLMLIGKMARSNPQNVGF